jgi:uncharacterized membrane protein
METDERLWSLFQIDQQRIGALNTNMITIRGWTITLTSAVAGFSLSQHHRSLLLVAMVGTVLFGLLDVRYRSTQLLHASRANKIEEQLVPEYRLRPHDPAGPPWLRSLVRLRYRSAISFYAVVLLFLLLLWSVT